MNTDIDYGLQKEKEIFEILKNKFDIELKKSDDKFSLFDYYSDNLFIELKSRRCYLSTYPDTMIGKNKIDFAEKANKPVIFVFSYFNGIYWYKYDKNDLIRSIEIRRGGRKDRGFNEIKDYCFIRTELLQKI